MDSTKTISWKTADELESNNGKKDIDLPEETVKQDITMMKGNEDLELLMLSCKKTEPRGDINLFEDMFKHWKTQEKQAEVSENDLVQKLEIHEKNKEEASRRIVDLEKTIDLLQKAIESLHNDLDLMGKLEKENMELQTAAKQRERKHSDQKEEFELRIASFEKQVKDDQTKCQDQIKELENVMDSKLKEKDSELKDMLETREMDIDKLKREKHSEIQLLTVEYETKLAKLQRHKATLSMNQQQSSSANQEIFRQKLHYLKKEHESETNKMKEQIRNLQGQLNAAMVNQQSGLQKKTSVSAQPLFKKSRRY